MFFFQAEVSIRGAQESRGLGDVNKKQEDNFMAAIWSKLGTSRKFAFMLDFLAAVTGVIEEFRKQHVETEEFTKAMVMDITAKVKTYRSHYLLSLIHI